MLLLLTIGYSKDSQPSKQAYSSLLDTALVKKSYTLDDIDFLLGNSDLRSYRFKYEAVGYYQKIVRISFLQNLVPITFEIGMVESGNYDFILKYGIGDTIKFNQYPYVASDKKVLLWNLKSKETLRLAEDIFTVSTTLPPVASKPASCPFHLLEYRGDTENEDTYFRYRLWCQIRDKEQLRIITDCYLLASEALAERKITLLLLAQWEDMIVRWNNDQIKRFLTHK